MSKRLSVGSGHQSPAPDLVRLDISAQVQPDIVWNLEDFPYPFKDKEFAEIECFDVIEHITDIPRTMEEFHRILRPDGLLKITTPHFSCANSYTDPTHRHHLSYFSFDYFTSDHKLAYYSHAEYRIRYRHLQFNGGRFNRSLLSRLANRFPTAYEQRWAWLFPAWYLYFELLAVKSS